MHHFSRLIRGHEPSLLVGAGGLKILAGRVRSGRVGSGRVGSGRVGSGRVGSGRVGSGRVRSGGVLKSHGSDRVSRFG